MVLVGVIRFLMVLDPIEAYNPLASERALMEMVGALDESWEIHLLHSRPVKYKRLPCRYVVHTVPFGLRPKSLIIKLLYLVASVIKGISVIKKHDICFTSCKGGHLYLGLAALIIARLTHRKCLVRVNENTLFSLGIALRKVGVPGLFIRVILGFGRALENIIFKSVDRILTHGPMDYERISRLVGPGKVVFIPLGVDLRKFRPLPKEEALKAKVELLGKRDLKVVLFVGRLDPIKDLPTLLRAFKILVDRLPNVVLLVIGWGMEAHKYMRMAKELGLSDKVVFLGFIPHDELPIYYNMADVYVLPSLYEEWSNTIMEAMACGIPVVATRVGSNPHLVKDGVTGFLIPPRDPSLLAERIYRILSDKELAAEMERRALEIVKKYDISSAWKSYKRELLGVVLSKRPQRIVPAHRNSGSYSISRAN